MKRVYFALSDDESAGSGKVPRLAIQVEMPGGQAAATFDRKRLGEAVKRDELMRGFERSLPDGSALRVQAFPVPQPPAELQKAEPPAEAPPSSPNSLDSLPLFAPPAFEPYRVRAWVNGQELREVIRPASPGSTRVAIAMLLLAGLSELVSGVRFYPLIGPTRFLFTGPVFLLGALGAWRGWKWSVGLAFAVAIADTILLVARSAQGEWRVFFSTILLRLIVIVVLGRLRRNS